MSDNHWIINGRVVSQEEWTYFLTAQRVSDRLQGDRDIGLAEINQMLGSMEFLSKQLREDRDFVLHAVSRNGAHLEFAPDRLRDDREVVLVAVQKSGIALEFASERLKNDWEVALAAIRNDEEAMKFVSPSLSHNEKFVAKALETNPNISGKFGFSFLEKRLNEEDIEFPQRMSYETLVTILHNRENPMLNDGKPVVVLIFPKGDWNGAFRDGHGVIDEIVGSKKFHVLYYEAGSDDSVSVILHRVQQIYPEQVSVLWLAGHGDREGIKFGEPKTLWESFVFGLPWMEEELFLDNDDLSSDDIFGQSISGMMQPKGQIILDSCSTGEGGSAVYNFANAIAEHVPPGVTVVSPPSRKMGVGSLSFDEDSIAVEFEDPRSTQRFHGKLLKK